jgi:hypothetical protein
MPPQRGKTSSVLAAFADRGKKAHAKVKDNETKAGNPELPPGIEGGIAQLTDCKFSYYKTGDLKGKPMFMASGVCIAPKEHEGVPTEGLSTRIGPEPLCDTPKRTRKTFDDHLDWIENIFRLLGIDTSDIEFTDLEKVAKDLEERKPYFRFRTWRGKPTKQFPNPRTNHEWNGVVEDYDPSADGAPGEEGGDVVDESGTEGESTNGDGAAEEGGEAGGDEGGAEASGDFPGDHELDALIESANAMDKTAQKTLNELGQKAGMSPKDIKAAESWEQVAEKIREARGEAGGEEGGEAGEGEGEGGEPEEEFLPKVEDIFGYSVKDPKKPKNPAKVIEVEVTTVNAKKKTVALKSTADAKVTFKDVPFDKLVDAPE